MHSIELIAPLSVQWEWSYPWELVALGVYPGEAAVPGFVCMFFGANCGIRSHSSRTLNTLELLRGLVIVVSGIEHAQQLARIEEELSKVSSYESCFCYKIKCHVFVPCQVKWTCLLFYKARM